MEEANTVKAPLVHQPEPEPGEDFDLPADALQHAEFYSLDSEEDRKTAFNTFVMRNHSYLSLVWGSPKHKDDWCCLSRPPVKMNANDWSAGTRGLCSCKAFPFMWLTVMTLVLNIYGTAYLGNAKGVKAFVLTLVFKPYVQKPMVFLFDKFEWLRTTGRHIKEDSGACSLKNCCFQLFGGILGTGVILLLMICTGMAAYYLATYGVNAATQKCCGSITAEVNSTTGHAGPACLESYFKNNDKNMICQDKDCSIECYGSFGIFGAVGGQEVFNEYCPAIACARGDYGMSGSYKYDGCTPEFPGIFEPYCKVYREHCRPIHLISPAIIGWVSAYIVDFLHELHYLCLLFSLLPEKALLKINENHRKNSVDWPTEKLLKKSHPATKQGWFGMSAEKDPEKKARAPWQIVLLVLYRPAAAYALLWPSPYYKDWQSPEPFPWICTYASYLLPELCKDPEKKVCAPIWGLVMLLAMPPICVAIALVVL